MKELYLLRSILMVTESIPELYFLDGIHFNKYSKQFDFLKQRYNDIGEVSEIDLYLHDHTKLPDSDFTLHIPKIIELGRYLFNEYHKNRILKEVKEIRNGDLNEVLDKMKELVDSVDDEYQKNKMEDTLADVIEPMLAKVEKLRKGEESNGIQLTTLPKMNEIIGGIMPTDLIGIYGKEKSSKTSLALEMMLDICIDQKIPGAIFSFEMDNELMSMKSLSMRLGININEFRNPSFTQLSDEDFYLMVGAAGKKVHRTKLYLIDQLLDEYEIEAKIRKLIDKGIKIVLIDYLMLISSRKKFNQNREELNHLSKFFKRLAQKYKIAIILISQANESGEREAEAKGLSRDSNYYFYVAKLEPNETVKINGSEYRAGSEEEYIVKNRGIRHAKGGGYFITKFVNNKYGEVSVEDYNHTFNGD